MYSVLSADLARNVQLYLQYDRRKIEEEKKKKKSDRGLFSNYFYLASLLDRIFDIYDQPRIKIVRRRVIDATRLPWNYNGNVIPLLRRVTTRGAHPV